MKKYIPAEIEAKWQTRWRRDKKWEVRNEKLDKEIGSEKVHPISHFKIPASHVRPPTSSKAKYYTLVELPYTSGDLHIGHWFTWAAADAHTRYKQMCGHAVFFPHGYDAFGLPAENAAIKRGVHPKDWTYSNIEAMTKQFRTMGTVADLDHVTVTADPEYYRWNQWIFLKMWERGIAYRGTALSNWCPKDKTVLADEHVEAGKCWRCGTEVEKKEVAQWFLKITEYADRLLWSETLAPASSLQPQASSDIDWPKSVRVGQNNWIGRSEGMLIEFPFPVGVQPLIGVEPLKVFTTRPDTTDGATFIVVSPEHEIVRGIKTSEIQNYVKQSQAKSEQERKENKEKTGVFTGLSVTNPVTGHKIPVWVADYVIMSYGTGAIMAVPSADERDMEFAKKFSLPIGRTNFKATPKGQKKVQYHIRDWSISRQRYWGTPVPIIHCPKCGTVPVPEKDLPVELPHDVDFTPTGKPPLATNEKWLNVKCPNCGASAKRDAETLDTFFDSSWYFYRYVSPNYNNGPFDKLKVKELLPVDVYFGGSEHTLGHTLYARFFTKFFKDLGLIDFEEFAARRVQHGVVLGPDGYRMSKSRGNVINPDELVAEYGADSVRLYLAFMMAYEDTGPWSPGALGGVYRFLKRVWGLIDKVDQTQSVATSQSQSKSGNEADFSRHYSRDPDIKDRRETGSNRFQLISTEDLTIMHKTVKKVGDDLEALKGNTAVAALMEWLNYLSKKTRISNFEFRNFLLLLAPFAPHITEELWSQMGADNSIHNQRWPQVDKKYLVGEVVKIPVQVDGYLRVVVEIAKEKADEKFVVEKALIQEKVKKYLEGKKYKAIFVPGRLLNFVTS